MIGAAIICRCGDVVSTSLACWREPEFELACPACALPQPVRELVDALVTADPVLDQYDRFRPSLAARAAQRAREMTPEPDEGAS